MFCIACDAARHAFLARLGAIGIPSTLLLTPFGPEFVVRGASLILPCLLQLGFLVRCWWPLLDKKTFLSEAPAFSYHAHCNWDSWYVVDDPSLITRIFLSEIPALSYYACRNWDSQYIVDDPCWINKHFVTVSSLVSYHELGFQVRCWQPQSDKKTFRQRFLLPWQYSFRPYW